MGDVRIRVLGPVEVEIDGALVRLSKPRHREILSLLVIARGRSVSTSRLIDDLWEEAPAGAAGTVQTFVGELRRLLEPSRAARTPTSIVVTKASGYALELPTSAVDLWRVEDVLGRRRSEQALSDALAEWTGGAFEEFDARDWARPERARIAELRIGTVERLGDVLLSLGRPTEVVALIDRHVDAHPWREEGWRLLALALYRCGRQGDALAILRRARDTFVEGLGLDPSDRLSELEQRIRRQDRDLLLSGSSILMQTASVRAAGGARYQIESATALLPLLALSGSVEAATERRVATIAAAEELGDPELTARVIVGYDVPGIWTRSDDPQKSAAIVAAADRAVALLPVGASERLRGRLLATIAMESRGVGSRMAEAREAESIARRLGDPAFLCLALGARYLHSVETTGQADVRASIGAEITELAVGSELSTFEIAGRLISMQALCALDDVPGASAQANKVDALAERFDRPLASVFTAWFRHTFGDGRLPPDGLEMPGFRSGLKELAQLTTAIRQGVALPDADLGPYEPWCRPLVLSFNEEHGRASDRLDTFADPPHDLLSEVCWYLIGKAAVAEGHRDSARRAFDALVPARFERAAGSGAVDLGKIGPLLDELRRLG